MRRIAVALILLTAAARGQVTPTLWVDTTGRPNAAAWELIRELSSIQNRGLDPQDYEAPRWQFAATELAATHRHDDSSIARFEAGLTAAFIRALTDLHGGRIDPAQLGYQLHLRQEAFDPTAVAGAALARGRISDAFDDIEPRLAQYRRITVALAFYRELAADSTLVPISRWRDTVRLGDRFPAAGTLRRWLVALGDLPAAHAVDPTSLYTEDLARGVRAF